MQQFRTVARNNRFPSLAPDVPGRHFPQRNQVSGKIRVTGSEIFSWTAHGARFQRNNTVHSAFIGGGRNLHQAQRVKRKIGGGKIPFLLSPQRKTAAILEKRKGIPFFVVPVCRRGRGELITSPTHTPCESMPLSPQSTPLKRVAHAGSILPNPGWLVNCVQFRQCSRTRKPHLRQGALRSRQT